LPRRAESTREAAGVGIIALGASWLLGAALLAAPAGLVAADRVRMHEIAIQGLLYVPETLTVRPGDVVVWINKDPFPHTVTAAGAFDSGSIAAGKSWRFTAKKAGTYPYLCTLHTTMKGTLRVE
jgi:plastocyanin